MKVVLCIWLSTEEQQAATALSWGTIYRSKPNQSKCLVKSTDWKIHLVLLFKSRIIFWQREKKWTTENEWTKTKHNVKLIIKVIDVPFGSCFSLHSVGMSLCHICSYGQCFSFHQSDRAQACTGITNSTHSLNIVVIKLFLCWIWSIGELALHSAVL